MPDSEPLNVTMFGTFSLTYGATRVSDENNRTRKVWLFLAYLICHRGQFAAAQTYIDLLWDEEDCGVNPMNAFKAILHRARTALNELRPEVGRQMILRRGSTYGWNPDFPVQLDTEDFVRLCQAGEAAEDEDEQLDLFLRALALYRGEFLSRLSSQIWVLPIAANYREMYLRLAARAIPLLQARERWEDLVRLCRAVVVQEPYTEEFYRHLMGGLIRLSRFREAARVYEDMAKLLMNNFGVTPSEETCRIYREALSALNGHTVPVDAVLDHLREGDGHAGALVCQYDVFRAIYHSVARSLIRSGAAVHLVLLSVHARAPEEELSRRSLNRAMENLTELMRASLRRGDVAAQCSASQFILMLPQANYENSQMICDRILRAFNKKYPHSPARLQSSVLPVEPS